MRRRRSTFLGLALLVATVAVVACGGENAASHLANAPKYDPSDQTKCSVRKSQAEPLIVEWPPAERGRLEAAVRSGLVAVRYSGCDMELRPYCHVKSEKYQYAPVTRKHDEVSIKDEDELYAQLPVGAARLEAKLQTAGELHVDMTLVGRWESQHGRVTRDELDGDCDGATHIVEAVTVGAFTFSAGAHADVGGGAKAGNIGAGGSSAAKRETLTTDGDESACTASTSKDSSPPEGCGAMIRIEVSPIGKAASHAAAAGAAVPPAAVVPAAVAGRNAGHGSGGSGISPWGNSTEPTPTTTSEATTSEPTAPPPPPTAPTPLPTVHTAPVDRYTYNPPPPANTGGSIVNGGSKGTLGTVVGWGSVGAIAAGSGLALLAAGTASKEVGDSSSSTDCYSQYHYCNSAGMSAYSAAHNEALAADILLGIGAVGAAVWLFLPVQVDAAPTTGGARVTVGGHF